MYLQSSFSELCGISANLCGIIAKAGTSKYIKKLKQILTFEINTVFNVFYNVSIYTYKIYIRKVVRGAVEHFQKNEWLSMGLCWTYMATSLFFQKLIFTSFSLTNRWQNFTQ